MEWRYRIVAPSGFRPRGLPEAESVPLGRGTYSHKFQAGLDGIVTGSLHFDTGSRRMTANEASALRDGVTRIMKAEPVVIYFDHSGEKLLAVDPMDIDEERLEHPLMTGGPFPSAASWRWRVQSQFLR